LIAALTYYPLFRAMAHFAHPLNMGAEIALVTVQVLYVTAVYGPVAAFLVEFFPAKIRYTSAVDPVPHRQRRVRRLAAVRRRESSWRRRATCSPA